MSDELSLCDTNGHGPELPADEFGGIHMEAFETTQDEIDNMPEFSGW